MIIYKNSIYLIYTLFISEAHSETKSLTILFETIRSKSSKGHNSSHPRKENDTKINFSLTKIFIAFFICLFYQLC